MRPKVGTLTVSFANVEAYESFDREKPFASRQLVHNLNRIWSPEWLDGTLRRYPDQLTLGLLRRLRGEA